MDETVLSGISINVSRPTTRNVLLLFIAAAGSTISWIGILSQLETYTDLFGDNMYIYLNLAVFVPLLPISILQAIWDDHFDAIYTFKRSFAFRGHMGFALSILCVLIIGYLKKNPIVLLSVVFVVGSASGILQGSLRQIATSLDREGNLSAAVTAGMQASAVMVVCFDMGTPNMLLFYDWIAVFLVISWLAFGVFCNRRSTMEVDDTLHEPLYDEINSTNSELSNGQSDVDSTPEDDNSQNESPSLSDDSLSYVELWKSSWYLGVILLVTVSSSMAVASWFNRFAGNLPEVLFYTRIFGDFLGRPATLLFPRLTKPPTTFLAMIRILFVPYFFLAVWGRVPVYDPIMVIGVFLYSFSSGFLATVCYQMAPRLLPPLADDDNADDSKNIMRQIKLLNVCFSISVVFGLMASLLLASID